MNERIQKNNHDHTVNNHHTTTTNDSQPSVALTSQDNQHNQHNKHHNNKDDLDSRKEYMQQLAQKVFDLSSEKELLYLERHGMLEQIQDDRDGSVLYRPSLFLLLQPFRPRGPHRYPEYYTGTKAVPATDD